MCPLRAGVCVCALLAPDASARGGVAHGVMLPKGDAFIADIDTKVLLASEMKLLSDRPPREARKIREAEVHFDRSP